MRALQVEDWRVHVDYSCAEISEAFLDENNVRFLVSIQDETGKLLLKDRFGYLLPGGEGPYYDKAHLMIKELKQARGPMGAAAASLRLLSWRPTGPFVWKIDLGKEV